MRVLMLPAPCKDTPAIPTDCPNCDALEKVKKALEKLRECATDKEEDAEDAQAEEGAEDAAEDAAEDGAAEEGGECMEPPMFSMDLILANEELDKSIAELYNQIIQVQLQNRMVSNSLFHVDPFLSYCQIFNHFYDDCCTQR